MPSLLPCILARQQPQRASVELEFLYLIAQYAMVCRCGGHLLLSRHVEPQLQAQQPVARRLLRVKRPRAGREPLRLAVANGLLAAQMVFVGHAALGYEAHCLYATVRMCRETAPVIIGVGTVKRVEHQERVEIIDRLVAQNPHQANAGSVYRPYAFYFLNNFSFFCCHIIYNL